MKPIKRLVIAICLLLQAAVPSAAQSPLQPPGYRSALIDYNTFESIPPYPLKTDFSMQRPIHMPVASRSMVYDPFGGGQSFTVHLKNIADNDWCYLLGKSQVISPYGGRGGRHHAGTDIKSFPNDTVRAVFAGVVVMSEPFAAYGNCVQIRHMNGLTTLYSHNVKNLVQTGDYVEVGQPVALEGRTGRATTEHVHFEIRVAGQHYDSELLFDHDTHQLQRHSLQFDRSGQVKIIK